MRSEFSLPREKSLFVFKTSKNQLILLLGDEFGHFILKSVVIYCSENPRATVADTQSTVPVCVLQWGGKA